MTKHFKEISFPDLSEYEQHLYNELTSWQKAAKENNSDQSNFNYCCGQADQYRATLLANGIRF